MIWLVAVGAAVEARADDWCKPETVESQVRRWGTAPFAKKKEYTSTVSALRDQLARELLGTLAAQLEPRYEPEVLALTSRVQTLRSDQRKVAGGREVCVVVQMPKGGLIGDLPSDTARQLLASWHDPVAAFAAGRPVWVREVAFRDRAAPEIDTVVIPRVEDLVRRNLADLPRWDPTGGPAPQDVITLDVRVTPYPAYYAIEGVARDPGGRAVSVGAELGRAWLGESGQRAPLSSKDVRIDQLQVPETIFLGRKAKITWNAPNARSCTLQPGFGDVPARGVVEAAPKADTTWTLTCTDGLATVSRDASVAVKVPPPQVAVAAHPNVVAPGGAAKLVWEGVSVTSCEIAPGIGPVGVRGELAVRPDGPTAYTVTCTDAAGAVAVGRALVEIGEAPPPMVALKIRSLDGEWVDVRVDGGAVGSLYTNQELVVEVPVGSHVLEVVPFMAQDASAKVRIAPKTGGEAAFGVRKEGPVECYDPSICQAL